MALLEQVEQYVNEFFSKHADLRFCYHGFQHTRDVVNRAKIVSGNSELTAREKELLLIAAWFHDIGYLITSSEHEAKSVEIANSFLSNKGLTETELSVISESIMATKYPQKPESNIAKHLCDADLYHLSLTNFFDISLILRKELNQISGEKLSKLQYWKLTIILFEEHSYHTEFGKSILNKGKERNLRILKRTAGKLEKKQLKKATKAVKFLKNKDKEIKTEIELKKVPIPVSKEEEYIQKIERLENKISEMKNPIRGIETMFRVAGQNQIKLSAIADNKANILISINVIVISIVISTISNSIDDNPILFIPGAFILFTCLITIIFAVLSTRPNISSGKFTMKDIIDQKVNLLFFGNFYNMELTEYEWGIRELMKDYDNLYGNLIKDQYFLGKVLARKYKYLRFAYTFFMYGFIVSVLAFVLVLIIS